MSEIEKKSEQEVSVSELKVGVINGDIPLDYYSNNPCLVGYSYLRVEVNGSILPCCIAKHFIGNAYNQDWRDVWHSGAYENFRKKMSRIHLDRFHMTDPEWTFCQQCSHLNLNQELNKSLKTKRD
jgi:radical SAM protein with 4Fe4S-binding SPASM domain